MSDDNNKSDYYSSLDSRFNQTIKNVKGLLKGRSVPGNVLLTRRTDPPDGLSFQELSPSFGRSFTESDASTSDRMDMSREAEAWSAIKPNSNASANKSKPTTSSPEFMSKEVQKPTMGARATDSARVMQFTKVLSSATVILDRVRELAWSGIPPYMRPDIWRLLLGYASPNSDRREGVLRRKRLEYLDSAAQFYDIPDTERSGDEINMLRQISVDCPRTVPDVTFF